MTWKRMMESAVKQSRSMLPTRVVLDHNEASKEYRTYLETLPENREPGFRYGRMFETESEALEDFKNRVARL